MKGVLLRGRQTGPRELLHFINTHEFSYRSDGPTGHPDMKENHSIDQGILKRIK